MDNLYFKKLPSEVLPTVSGNNVIIVETKSGKLYWCDSGGAKRLMSADEEHPVGTHYIQFYGEPTPAAKYGGTWEEDTDYAGRTIVFAGTGFTFGATGGATTHSHTSGNLMAHLSIEDSTHFDIHAVNGGAWNATQRVQTSGLASNTKAHGDGVEIGGSTAQTSVMSPYKVVIIWKRTPL